jgi:hypothetical protein
MLSKGEAMLSLYDPENRDAVVRRLAALQPTSQRQWGKMTVAQMLAHCAKALEVPCGDRVETQSLIGRVLAPFAKPSVLGEKPMNQNAPTSPTLRVTDDRDFARERERLVALVDRFCSRGPAVTDGIVHNFFGRLTADQWGRLMYKHLDHHLRQFST